MRTHPSEEGRTEPCREGKVQNHGDKPGHVGEGVGGVLTESQVTEERMSNDEIGELRLSYSG